MRFRVVITWDEEYRGYVVDVPSLVGCMSQGRTLDEALANVKDAIKGWMVAEGRKGALDLAEDKEMFLGEVTV
jgi:predicted RNase H-like HicB family nuclease